MQIPKTPVYLKTITLRDISEIPSIKEDSKKNMILIMRVTPLAQKDVDELRKAIDESIQVCTSIWWRYCEVGGRACSNNSPRCQNLARNPRLEIIKIRSVHES